MNPRHSREAGLRLNKDGPGHGHTFATFLNYAHNTGRKSPHGVDFLCLTGISLVCKLQIFPKPHHALGDGLTETGLGVTGSSLWPTSVW